MSHNVPFTANQIKFIEWLATPKFDRAPPTQELLADKMGLNRKTLYRWKKLDGLQEAVNQRARELLGSDLPEIYGALRREAIKGNYQHIKLAFEMTGEYVDAGSSEDTPFIVKVVYGNEGTDRQSETTASETD